MRRNAVGLLGLCIVLASCTPALPESQSASAMDLIPDYPESDLSADSYSYLDHVAMLKSIPVPSHDYLMAGVEPVEVLFASYSMGDFGAFVEVHEFASEEEANREYSYQNPGNGIGEIFFRFSTEEWMVQRGRFLVFVFCYPGHGESGHEDAAAMLVDLLGKIAERLVEVASWELVQDIPDSDFAGEVTWGIRPGDEITWRSGESSMYSPGEGETLTWEIVTISGDGLAVLMRRPRESIEAIQQPGWASGRELVYTEQIEIPHHEYTWSTAEDDGLKFDGTSTLIFPLERGGESLSEIVEGKIGYLPERRVTDGETSVSAHGKTSTGMGFTPLKNEWLDISVHKGTGVVTSYDWYYNDREYSVQSSKTYSLIDTSFDMGERPPGGGGAEVGEGALLFVLLVTIAWSIGGRGPWFTPWGRAPC